MSTEISTACAYCGTSTNTMSSLDHLEDEYVAVLANGEVLSQQQVSSGAISLTNWYSIVHAGLPYYSDFETLNIEIPLKGYESLQGVKVKIAEATFRLRDSRGGYVGQDEDNLWEAFTQDQFRRSSGQNLGDTELFTGDIRVPIGSEFLGGGRIFYRQYDPLPITIGAIMPEVNIGGVSR